MRRIIELLIEIWFGKRWIPDFLFEVSSERLDNREYDFSLIGENGITFNVVEETVGVRGLVGVYTVKIHDLKQRNV